MSSILRCDICMRTKGEMEKNGLSCDTIIQHKFRRKGRFLRADEWEDIDICTSCLKQIRAKSRGEEE